MIYLDLLLCIGSLIKDLERRYDVALSDLSFLKMDNTQKASHIIALEEECATLGRKVEETRSQIERLTSQVR